MIQSVPSSIRTRKSTQFSYEVPSSVTGFVAGKESGKLAVVRQSWRHGQCMHRPLTHTQSYTYTHTHHLEGTAEVILRTLTVKSTFYSQKTLRILELVTVYWGAGRLFPGRNITKALESCSDIADILRRNDNVASFSLLIGLLLFCIPINVRYMSYSFLVHF